jgi:hypothetical protein
VEERLMMDGKAGKAVSSKIHSPYTHGVNSVVWVQERATLGRIILLTSPGFGTRGKELPNKDYAMCGNIRIY